MSKRPALSRRNVDDDDEDSCCGHKHGNEDAPKSKKKESPGGFNYYAIAFLVLFILPTVITLSAEVGE
jgi:hypothetical protein